jgi:hypothetical protein
MLLRTTRTTMHRSSRLQMGNAAATTTIPVVLGIDGITTATWRRTQHVWLRKLVMIDVDRSDVRSRSNCALRFG